MDIMPLCCPHKINFQLFNLEDTNFFNMGTCPGAPLPYTGDKHQVDGLPFTVTPPALHYFKICLVDCDSTA